jgi:hypothetical protein
MDVDGDGTPELLYEQMQEGFGVERGYLKMNGDNIKLEIPFLACGC